MGLSFTRDRLAAAGEAGAAVGDARGERRLVRRRGIGILEALVALAITALVLSALAGAVERAAAARDRATRGAERTAAGRRLLLRIADEIDGALVADEPGTPDRFVVVAPADGAPPWWTLRLASSVMDELRVVSYRVETDGVLVRRAASRFQPPDAPEPRGVAAVRGVRSFRIRCFDGTAWRSGWTAPGLPRAVEIALGVDDGAGGVDELATTVTVPLGS